MVVTSCHNLPYNGSAGKKPRSVFQKGKRARVATNIYSRKTLEKPKKRPANFENKDSGVVYAWGKY